MKSRTLSTNLIQMILLTMLGVLMYVSQVIMAALPNIELVSFLIIVITRKFSYKALISVYVFVFCEILTYGFEIWVINYLYVWAILCVAVMFVSKVDNAFFYAVIAAFYGLFFGILCSLPYFITGGFAAGIAFITGGLWFDLLHCGGNFVLVLLLYRPITKAMNKIIK